MWVNYLRRFRFHFDYTDRNSIRGSHGLGRFTCESLSIRIRDTILIKLLERQTKARVWLRVLSLGNRHRPAPLVLYCVVWSGLQVIVLTQAAFHQRSINQNQYLFAFSYHRFLSTLYIHSIIIQTTSSYQNAVLIIKHLKRGCTIGKEVYDLNLVIKVNVVKLLNWWHTYGFRFPS